MMTAVDTSEPARHRNMSRYKGRTSFKSVERDFPHIVDMAVPPGGLGKKLDAMYAFHARHGIQPMRGRSRRDEDPK
jgi:hypothetical protein